MESFSLEDLQKNIELKTKERALLVEERNELIRPLNAKIVEKFQEIEKYKNEILRRKNEEFKRCLFDVKANNEFKALLPEGLIFLAFLPDYNHQCLLMLSIQSFDYWSKNRVDISTFVENTYYPAAEFKGILLSGERQIYIEQVIEEGQIAYQLSRFNSLNGKLENMYSAGSGDFDVFDSFDEAVEFASRSNLLDI